MTYNYFLTCKDEEDVRKTYKKLAMKLHPDMGGSNDSFVAMKAEYDYIIANDVVYPLSNITPTNALQDFISRANEHIRKYPVTPEQATPMTEQELNNLKAKNYFDRLRKDDGMFDVIDGLLEQATKEKLTKLWLNQQIGKLFDLNIDHFKYLTWKLGDPVSLANFLYKKYRLNMVRR